MCRFWLSILLIGGFFGCGESDQNSSDAERNPKTPKEAKIPLQSQKTKIEKTSPFKPQGIHNVKFVGIEMIWVPAGSFQMGSPFNSPVRIMDEKPHNVELTRGFYLGKYEITQRQYALVMEDNVQDLKPLPSRFKGPSLPVEQVSWKDVQEFCARLTYLERRDQRLNKGGLIVYLLKRSGSMPVGQEPPPFIHGVMKFFLKMRPTGKVPAKPD